MLLRRLNILTLVIVAVAAVGCQKPTVDVDVHGVNYSGNEFFFTLRDPASKTPGSVGEHIDPFAAGGTTCCYSLPEEWRPGIRVEVFTRHWLPVRPDGSLPTVEETRIVEVPQYVDGKPGELWVVRSGEGVISLVSSSYQPDHPKWPGVVKGWPTPSLDYQRQRWELHRAHQEHFVKTYESLLAQLARSPQEEAKAAWQNAEKYAPQTIKSFTGPTDPKYIQAVREEYSNALNTAKARLQKLLEEKP